MRTDGAEPIIKKRMEKFECLNFAELSRWADVIHFDLYENFECNYSKVLAAKSIVTLVNFRFSIGFIRRSLKYHFPIFFTAMSQTIADNVKVAAEIIYSGVDTERFKPLAKVEKKYDVLILGRMRPIKNHRLFIDICKKGNFSFVAIGGTAGHFTGHVNEIEQMVRGAAKPGRDFVPGVVEDQEIVPLINQARVAVVTSVSEGLGLNALEPMSCGLPVVAVDNGGSKEALGSDNLCGMVLDKSTTLQDFVEAIQKCMNDKDMQRNARERICTIFSMDKVFDGYSKVYSKICGER